MRSEIPRRRTAWVTAITGAALAGAVVAALGVASGERKLTVRAGPVAVPVAAEWVIAAPVTGTGPLLDFSWGPGWVTARGPAGMQGGVREVFWYGDATPVLNSETCATWTVAQGAIAQQGAAVRIANRNGVLHAITVTRNIFGGSTWVFNVHVWSGAVGTLIGQFDLASVLKVSATASRPLPWRLCARVIDRTVEFKVWPLNGSEPEWGDSSFGGWAELPPGWNYAGLSGWYAGHLGTGDVAGYGDLSVTTLRQTQRQV